MSDTPDKPEQIPVPETVNCAVCRREIPRSDAIKDEGEEYLRWYCGFDCYQRGQQNNPTTD